MTWRKRIRGCLATSNFSIIINGRPRGKIHASRGLRQRDPLSPFLFTIIGDAVSRSMQLCLERRILKCFVVGKYRVEVLILQYADDTLIFCHNDFEMLRSWWEIMTLVLTSAGLSLNLGKTSLIGINIDDNVVIDWANELQCRPESLPINYLGFPLGGNHHRKSFLESLLDKLRARLDVWRCLLSKGGRVTLAQSISPQSF